MTIAIIGAGGHGHTVKDCILSAGTLGAVEFFDDQIGTPTKALFEDADFKRWSVIVAIGDNVHRKRLTEHVVELGGKLWTARHYQSFVSASAFVGVGSSIHFGAHVGPDARIGRGCIVNNLATVGHGCQVGDYVNICDGTVLGGNVMVGMDAFIGLNATILPGVNIGAGARIGAGAVVAHDVVAGKTVFGNPARVFK